MTNPIVKKKPSITRTQHRARKYKQQTRELKDMKFNMQVLASLERLMRTTGDIRDELRLTMS